MAQRQESSEPDPARPPLLVILGENVFRRRVLRVPKMSQGGLAHISDVAVNTIAGIEMGRDPSHKPPAYPQLLNHRDGSQLRRYAAASEPRLRQAVARLAVSS